jgi:hypothetical protein
MFTNSPLPGESARAFAAFSVYRDLGSTRSLTGAWEKHCSNTGAVETQCPGHWQRWSVRWQWVERARQCDIELDALKREAYADKMRELEQDRAEFEFKNQKILEGSVHEMEAMLQKANAAPITDITQSKEEVVDGKVVKNVNKVKGISMSAYAHLVKARNETAKQAIVGVRGKPAEVEARLVERVVLKTERPS